MRKWLVVILALLPLLAAASIDVYEFQSLEQEQRFHRLTEELRCPKCQNQSINGSDADIARDMRGRVALMIQQGASDEEIVGYFVSRYGDFVSYKPPVRAETLVLWVAPSLVIVLGLLVIVFQVRRARRFVGQSEEQEVANEESLP